MAGSLEDGDWIWSQEICNEEVCWNLRGALLSLLGCYFVILSTQLLPGTRENTQDQNLWATAIIYYVVGNCTRNFPILEVLWQSMWSNSTHSQAFTVGEFTVFTGHLSCEETR